MKKLILLFIFIFSSSLFAQDHVVQMDLRTKPGFYVNYHQNLSRNSKGIEPGIVFTKFEPLDEINVEAMRFESIIRTGIEDKVNFRFSLVQIDIDMDLLFIKHEDHKDVKESGLVALSIDMFDIDYTKYLDYEIKWFNMNFGPGYAKNVGNSRLEIPLLFNVGITTLQPGTEYHPKLKGDAENTVTGFQFGLGTDISYSHPKFRVNWNAMARMLVGNHFIWTAASEFQFEYKIIPQKDYKKNRFQAVSPLSLVASIGAENIFFKSKEDMNSWASVGLKMYLF